AELIPVVNVLLFPSGVNLRIERRLLASVTAPSETKRFPSRSKHKPSGYSPVAKALFVPSGVYLNTECLEESATYGLPAASKANPPACAFMKPKIVPTPAIARIMNCLPINVLQLPAVSSFFEVHRVSKLLDIGLALRLGFR